MYKLRLHKNLNKEKWSSFGLSRQILMIANELNRAKNWLIKGELDEVANCYERAFELLDLTIELAARRNLRKELLRFREILAWQYVVEQKEVSVNQRLFDVLLSLNKDSYNLLVS